MYKVIYDLVAIPTSEYLTLNIRQSRHIHALGKCLQTDSHSQKLLQVHIFPQDHYALEALAAYILVLLTLAQLFSNAVYQVIHVSP